MGKLRRVEANYLRRVVERWGSFRIGADWKARLWYGEANYFWSGKDG